jgi:UDP-glucuronate 4-epimerase
MKTILISGGAGFIGSHLIERMLINKNNKIVVIDNFNNFYEPSLKERNIQELLVTKQKQDLDDDYLKIYRGDIRDNNFVNEVFNTTI